MKAGGFAANERTNEPRKIISWSTDHNGVSFAAHFVRRQLIRSCFRIESFIKSYFKICFSTWNARTTRYLRQTSNGEHSKCGKDFSSFSVKEIIKKEKFPQNMITVRSGALNCFGEWCASAGVEWIICGHGKMAAVNAIAAPQKANERNDTNSVE